MARTRIPAVAKAVGISERNAERLLTALAAMTLLTREGERFANAPDVQRFLVKDGERYAGPWILFTKPRWNGLWRAGRAPAPREENRLGHYESSPSTTPGATTPPPTRSAWARPACSAAASTSPAAS